MRCASSRLRLGRGTIRPVFADLMVSQPVWLRLSVWMLICVGLTLLIAWRLHHRILQHHHRAQPPRTDDGDLPDNVPPGSGDLSGHLIRVLSLAFVFILGFTLSNFWSTSKAADAATQDEVAAYSRAIALAEAIPAQSGGQGLLDALAVYRQAAVGQDTLLQHADAPAAYLAQDEAGSSLLTAIIASGNAGAAKAPEWDAFTSAIDDMVTGGRERVDALPSVMATGIIWLLIVLAVGNLVAIAVFSPTRFGVTLVILAGLAAAFALLLFVVIETSNPYWGAGAHSTATAGIGLG